MVVSSTQRRRSRSPRQRRGGAAMAAARSSGRNSRGDVASERGAGCRGASRRGESRSVARAVLDRLAAAAAAAAAAGGATRVVDAANRELALHVAASPVDAGALSAAAQSSRESRRQTQQQQQLTSHNKPCFPAHTYNELPTEARRDVQKTLEDLFSSRAAAVLERYREALHKVRDIEFKAAGGGQEQLVELSAALRQLIDAERKRLAYLTKLQQEAEVLADGLVAGAAQMASGAGGAVFNPGPALMKLAGGVAVGRSRARRTLRD